MPRKKKLADAVAEIKLGPDFIPSTADNFDPQPLNVTDEQREELPKLDVQNDNGEAFDFDVDGYENPWVGLEDLPKEELKLVTTKYHSYIYETNDISGARIHISMKLDLEVFDKQVWDRHHTAKFYQIANGDLMFKYIRVEDVAYETDL